MFFRPLPWRIRAGEGLFVFARALALLSLALGCACGPALAPKQAMFFVEGCPDGGAAIDPASAVWELHTGPILTRGEPGSWDAADVLNPSVARVNGVFHNLYSGFDGTAWRSGLATSEDGIGWKKHMGAVLSPDPATWESGYIAANGAVLHDGEQFHYWYQAGPRGSTAIGLARSADAIAWDKHPQPVLRNGPPGSWDETAVGDPYAVGCGNTYYLYYVGQNRKGIQRLGVARSTNGVHWRKSHANPILDTGPPGSFDQRGLGEPAVIRASGEWWMLYTGRDESERRRMGWARSANGIDWAKASGAEPFEGGQPWNSAVVCDAALLAEGDTIRMWYGGGDRPSPDENLNGQIGLAELTAARGATGR